MDDFTNLIQSLPPELFNKIYTEVFTVRPTEQDIDRTYKPPQLLAVDRASRASFAKSYYTYTTFQIHDNGVKCIDRSRANAELILARKWLRQLPQSHLSSIGKLRITVYRKIAMTRACDRWCRMPKWQECFISRARDGYLRYFSEGTGLEVPSSVVRVEAHIVSEEDGREDIWSG